MPNTQARLIDLLDDISTGKDVFFKSVRFVKDVMTENVKTLTPSDTIETSLEFMQDYHVRHIPVVDCSTPADGNLHLIGIISQRDVFRQISPYLGKSGQLDSDSKALKQPLVQLVTRNPKFASPDTPVTDAITIMIDNRVDILPVLSGGLLTGIITSTDILKLFVRLDTICQICRKMDEKKQRKQFINALSGSAENTIFGLSNVLRTVEDVMTENVVSLDRHDTIAAAIAAMRKGKLRHIPITDKEDRLLAIVSDRDILQYLPFHNSRSQPGSNLFRDNLFEVAPNNQAAQQTLNHIMKTDVTYVLPGFDFYTAVNMLYETKISCIPVTDEQKKLLGIVTVTDVMRGLLAAYALFDKAAP